MSDFKVIKILNENEILINAGVNQDVYSEDILEIFSPGEEVKDPDTGEVLGTLDTIKAKIKVSHAYENMSLCENAQQRRVDPFSSVSSLMAGSYQQIPLNIDSGQISGSPKVTNKKIRIGDPVRKANELD